jgi:hypothetical protein
MDFDVRRVMVCSPRTLGKALVLITIQHVQAHQSMMSAFDKTLKTHLLTGLGHSLSWMRRPAMQELWKEIEDVAPRRMHYKKMGANAKNRPPCSTKMSARSRSSGW